MHFVIKKRIHTIVDYVKNYQASRDTMVRAA